jgi:hypothetical protein
MLIGSRRDAADQHHLGDPGSDHDLAAVCAIDENSGERSHHDVREGAESQAQTGLQGRAGETEHQQRDREDTEEVTE